MEADVFVFDESSQKHKWYLEAFDRLLRELTRINLPFGKNMWLWEVNMENAFQ